MTADQSRPKEFDLPDARKALAVFRYRADPKDATDALEQALDEVKRLRDNLATAEEREAANDAGIAAVQRKVDAILRAHAAESVVRAACICYPTIHGHATDCEIYRDRDCTCGRRAHAAALGAALEEYDAFVLANGK